MDATSAGSNGGHSIQQASIVVPKYHIRAVLRRRTDPDPFVLGDVVIDYRRHQVTVAGHKVDLPATEFELLRVLSDAEPPTPRPALSLLTLAGAHSPKRTACIGPPSAGIMLCTRRRFRA